MQVLWLEFGTHALNGEGEEANEANRPAESEGNDKTGENFRSEEGTGPYCEGDDVEGPKEEEDGRRAAGFGVVDIGQDWANVECDEFESVGLNDSHGRANDGNEDEVTETKEDNESE